MKNTYLWLRCSQSQLKSGGRSSVPLYPHHYILMDCLPLDCALQSLQQSGPSQFICPYTLNSSLSSLWKPAELKFSSSSDGFARCRTCYRLSATSPPSARWAVKVWNIHYQYQLLYEATVSLLHGDLHLYLSTDAESFPEKDEAWSSEISRGLTSFLLPE